MEKRYCVSIILSNPRAGELYDHWPWEFPKYYCGSAAPRGWPGATWTQEAEKATTFASQAEAELVVAALVKEQLRPSSDFGETIIVTDFEEAVEHFKNETRKLFCLKLSCFTREVVPPYGRKPEDYPFYYLGKADGSDMGYYWKPEWTRDASKATVFRTRKDAEIVRRALHNSTHVNRLDESVFVQEWPSSAAEGSGSVDARSAIPGDSERDSRPSDPSQGNSGFHSG